MTEIIFVRTVELTRKQLKKGFKTEQTKAYLENARALLKKYKEELASIESVVLPDFVFVERTFHEKPLSNFLSIINLSSDFTLDEFCAACDRNNIENVSISHFKDEEDYYQYERTIVKFIDEERARREQLNIFNGRTKNHLDSIQLKKSSVKHIEREIDQYEIILNSSASLGNGSDFLKDCCKNQQKYLNRKSVKCRVTSDNDTMVIHLDQPLDEIELLDFGVPVRIEHRI